MALMDPSVLAVVTVRAGRADRGVSRVRASGGSSGGGWWGRVGGMERNGGWWVGDLKEWNEGPKTSGGWMVEGNRWNGMVEWTIWTQEGDKGTRRGGGGAVSDGMLLSGGDGCGAGVGVTRCGDRWSLMGAVIAA